MSRGCETTSWVVLDKRTGKGLFETWNPKLVAALNTSRYEAIPIIEWLGELNQRIANGDYDISIFRSPDEAA
jgi:hypothetical protein